MKDRPSSSWIYPAATGDPGRDRNARSLQFAFLLAVVGIASLMVIDGIRGYRGDLPVMASAAVGLLAAAAINRLGKWEWAARTAALLMLAMIVALIHQARDGLRSHSMILFPGLLLLSVMVLDRAFYVAVAGLVLAAVTALGIAEMRGLWRMPPVRTPTDYASILTVDVMLLFIAAIGSRISRDNQRNVSDLRASIHQLGEAYRDLSHEAERYASLIELAVDAIFLLDGDGRIVDVNRQACVLTGLARDALIGASLPALLSPAEPGADPLPLDAIAAGAGTRSECRIARPDGSWVEAELRSGLMPGGHIQCFCRDMGERKRAEEALRQSQQQYLTLAKCIPDVIWSMDLDGHFTYVSPSVERTHGWTVEEALRLHRGAMTTPAQAAKDDLLLRQELERAASPDYDRNRVMTFESEQLRRDGTTFWTEISASFLWSEDGKILGLTGVSRDIRDRKRAEVEREKLWAQLAQAQKMESVGRLAGGVAHDFNNLLTVINGYSRMALNRLAEGNPLRAQLDQIYKAGERAAGLTRQLLAFSRKQVLQPRKLNLNGVVEDMRKMLERLMGEDVEVRLALGQETPAINADLHQFEQVIMNLAVNARDAMPRGGRLLLETGLVERDAGDAAAHPESQPGSYAVLTVRDTGVGIDEQTRLKIFEPFFTTKGPGKGTGLGLSMVQGIVAQSGGYVDVTSEPGRGTAFHIYLPAAEGVSAEREPPAGLSPSRGKETILLAEDQGEVRNFAAAVLEECGYRVIPAASADEAEKACAREAGPIHLVLTDVVMPGTSGREMIPRLKKTRPGIKVIFMSGYTDDVIAHHGVLEEGSYFLQKPFAPEELMEKVREALDASTQER